MHAADECDTHDCIDGSSSEGNNEGLDSVPTWKSGSNNKYKRWSLAVNKQFQIRFEQNLGKGVRAFPLGEYRYVHASIKTTQCASVVEKKSIGYL